MLVEARGLMCIVNQRCQPTVEYTGLLGQNCNPVLEENYSRVWVVCPQNGSLPLLKAHLSRIESGVPRSTQNTFLRTYCCSCKFLNLVKIQPGMLNAQFSRSVSRTAVYTQHIRGQNKVGSTSTEVGVKQTY